MKKNTTPRLKSRALAHAQVQREQCERLVEQIMADRGKALEAAVDFSPLYGAPLWMVRLILPDMQPLLAKPASRWLAREIRQLQESVNTLPFRILLAAATEPCLV